MRPLRFIPLIALGLACTTIPVVGRAQIAIGVSITIAPPALPVYVQPAIPAPGYIWAPGYWAYGPEGYYWVPGTWVLPPAVGLLWTPGYWGWNNGAYIWNAGYWGPHVGFYGGINYGFGYTGIGYAGGYWNHGAFFYNRSVNNFSNVHITNVYNRTVVNNTIINRVSYNGGAGGSVARPTGQQLAFAHEQHVLPTQLQVQHAQIAASNRELLASMNHGRPPVAATSQPGRFSGQGVVAARQTGGPFNPAAGRAPNGAPGPAIARHAEATPGTPPALREPGSQHPPGSPAVPAAAERAASHQPARPGPHQQAFHVAAPSYAPPRPQVHERPAPHPPAPHQAERREPPR
jgi:WXXGXW repeat (2 copies)